MDQSIQVKVLNLSHHLELPEYSTPEADAMDLRACFDLNKAENGYESKIREYDPSNMESSSIVNIDDEYILYPGMRVLIPTGLKVQLPPGYEFAIKSRSGLALKSGIIVLNSPGTVDSDYRGEIGVILMNTSDKSFSIHHGDRIAQMAIKKSNQVTWNPVTSEGELNMTERADGGWGHSGIK